MSENGKVQPSPRPRCIKAGRRDGRETPLLALRGLRELRAAPADHQPECGALGAACKRNPAEEPEASPGCTVAPAGSPAKVTKCVFSWSRSIFFQENVSRDVEMLGACSRYLLGNSEEQQAGPASPSPPQPHEWRQAHGRHPTGRPRPLHAPQTRASPAHLSVCLRRQGFEHPPAPPALPLPLREEVGPAPG